METGGYEVGKLLGETDFADLYRCTLPDKTLGVLKIAKELSDNGRLDREAFVVRLLKEAAECLEEEFAKTKPNKDEFLGYGLFFPNPVESFVAEDEGGKRINIVNFLAVPEDLGRLVPLAHFVDRAQERIDQKTSAWICGKLLKALAFAHNQGISVGQIDGENILIEKNKHHVLIFDWSNAISHPSGTVPQSVAREEISQVAKVVILALGGNTETGELPPDELVTEKDYQEFLFSLASGNEDNALQANEKFYRLIRSLWPREFHPFTVYGLD